jgi:hypothetical protein
LTGHNPATGSGTATYAYEDLGPLTTEATLAGTLSNTYGLAGNIAFLASSNANGVSVFYTCDMRGWIKAANSGR